MTIRGCDAVGKGGLDCARRQALCCVACVLHVAVDHVVSVLGLEEALSGATHRPFVLFAATAVAFGGCRVGVCTVSGGKEWVCGVRHRGLELTAVEHNLI